MNFRVKDVRVFRNLLTHAWHPKLIDVYFWFIEQYPHATITSGPRPGSGVHGQDPFRGLDIRAHEFENPQSVANDLNGHWLYDVDRPEKRCMLYHAVCPSCGQDHRDEFQENCAQCGAYIKLYWHLHMQVHENTIKLESENGERVNLE